MRTERIGDAVLILGDCREVALEHRQRHDLLLTDPPYGTSTKTTTVSSGRGFDRRRGKRWGYDWKPVEGDTAPFDPLPLLGFRCAVLWGANHYADKLPASSCWFAAKADG